MCIDVRLLLLLLLRAWWRAITFIGLTGVVWNPATAQRRASVATWNAVPMLHRTTWSYESRHIAGVYYYYQRPPPMKRMGKVIGPVCKAIPRKRGSRSRLLLFEVAPSTNRKRTSKNFLKLRPPTSPIECAERGKPLDRSFHVRPNLYDEKGSCVSHSILIVQFSWWGNLLFVRFAEILTSLRLLYRLDSLSENLWFRKQTFRIVIARFLYFSKKRFNGFLHRSSTIRLHRSIFAYYVCT